VKVTESEVNFLLYIYSWFDYWANKWWWWWWSDFVARHQANLMSLKQTNANFLQNCSNSGLKTRHAKTVHIFLSLLPVKARKSSQIHFQKIQYGEQR